MPTALRRVRRELLTAVGWFAETVGFMVCDDFAHDDARRMYRFALACAEEAGDWHLRTQVLGSTAYQASWCGDPDAGLAYTESALVRARRLTATERAMLHNSRARYLAKLGEVQDALSAICAADEEFSHARPAEDAPWMASYAEVRHTGWAGYVLWELDMQGQFVAEARNRLTAGIVASSEDRARSQIKLASLIMATGDPLEAVALGTQALDWAGPLRSRRATDDLSELRRLAEPHTRLPEVAELSGRLRKSVGG